jgi:hypothetical protein
VLLRLGGAALRPLLLVLAEDARTIPPLREHLADALGTPR